MAIGDGIRAKRVGARAFERYRAEGWAAAAAEIAAAPARLAAEAWAQLGVALENEEQTDDARQALQCSRALAPARTDTLLFLAELERDAGNDDAAIAHYRALLAAAPGAAEQAGDLARLLAARDAFDEIIELALPFREHGTIELRVLLLRALFERERHQEVVAISGQIIRDGDHELRASLSGEARGELIDRLQEATALHDDSFATLYGRERVVEAEAHRGRLVAHSGTNYKLLGQARMAAEPGWIPDTVLRDVDGTRALGEALIARGERSRGLCHLGVAALRRNQASRARDLFEKARDADEDNFAAFLGIGAAIDHDQSRVVGRVKQLPAAPAALSPELARVLVDWPVLTRDERISVHAALAPLAAQLPAVAEAGAIVRVLPIDARLIDLAEFKDDSGVRLEDERCLDAITGAAMSTLCASKVEELLIFAGERSWVFAHELAHLVHYHLPNERCAELDALFEELAAHDYVLTNYQNTNVAEFFAVAYEDYLRDLYGLPSTREAGREHLEGVFAFIDELSA